MIKGKKMIQTESQNQPLTNFDLYNQYESAIMIEILRQRIHNYFVGTYYRLKTRFGDDVVDLLTVADLDYSKVRESAIELLNQLVADEVESEPTQEFIEVFVSAVWHTYLIETSKLSYKPLFNSHGNKIDYSIPAEKLRFEKTVSGNIVVFHEDGSLYPEHYLFGQFDQSTIINS